MTPPTLTRRDLNRATLARQLLLERSTLSIIQAVEQVAGLQAQIPNPPYIGLWTRLEAFARDDLTRLMEARQIVRAAMMRSTLHLVTADDHQRWRGTLQAALVRALGAFFGQRGKGLDIEALVAAAREYLEAEPRSTGDLAKRLLEVQPGRDKDALAYAVRAYLPLVQVPPGGTWGTGSAATYATARAWLGGDPQPDDVRGLLWRYLRAFGPASVKDFQFWSGLVKQGEVIEALKDELVSYSDEGGRELLDLPGMPLPGGDVPAPLRFIPEYDNLLIAHNDRTRVIADEDYPKVFLSAARVLGTFLVDGFVSGVWKVEREKKAVALVIEPFRPLAPDVRDGLAAEGKRLLPFIEDKASSYAVRFAGG
jgi:hypothetical protein